MAADTLRHPTLNCILRGKPSRSTVQFRNLKYGTIPGRWQDSVLNNELTQDDNGVYDATHFGPSCPQSLRAQAIDLSFTGSSNLVMPFEEGIEEPMDELSCLQINVTVPKAVLEQGKDVAKLPVFVWVHGGGLSIGSNNWPQYNLTQFVERSCEIGKPVVGVAMNYRLGILGFLASKELGIDGNFGYKDQVLAFRWIKKHIAGFGGDPGRITASGESAGGISLSTLLCVNVEDEGLFDRVVVMSGEAMLRKCRIRSWHDQMYNDQLKLLGLENKSVKERTKQLRDIGAVELQQKLPFVQYWCACVDGEFLKENITLDMMANPRRSEHKPSWCKYFVNGDMRHDATILHDRVLANPKVFDNLKAACAKYLTEAETSNLLSLYNLPSSSPDQRRRSLNELFSDLRFYIGTIAAHRGWKAAVGPSRASRYYVHVPNTIEGEFTGLASHELDVAFILQNYSLHLDEGSKRVAVQMTDQWIRYANGEPWCEPEQLIVIGEDGLSRLNEAEYDDKFRNGSGKVLDALGFDRMWQVAEAWQGIRIEEPESGAKVKL